jgi:mannose-6-phosphate isomerase-like protein (cupin superfamily)
VSEAQFFTRQWDDTQVSDMAFGRGVSKHLAGLADGIASVDVHINEIIPNTGLGHYHVHKRADNIYLILAGTMQVVIGQRRHVASAGSAIVIPAGTPHAAGNAGEQTARVIEIYAPAGDDFHILRPPDAVVDDSNGEEVECDFRWEGD